MSSWKIPEFKKLRLYFAWLVGVILFFIARTTDTGFCMGIPVTVLGETLRVWAQGCIEKRTKLAVSGPYAYTRNPLYLANFLIGLGFVLVLSNLWYVFIYQVGFFILYRGTILEEEKFLAGEYGLLYEDYLKNVPRFFPKFSPYPNRTQEPFQWRLVMKHGETVTLTTILLLFNVLYLRQECFQNGKGFFPGHIVILVTAAALAVLLVFFIVHRKFKKN